MALYEVETNAHFLIAWEHYVLTIRAIIRRGLVGFGSLPMCLYQRTSHITST